MLIRWNTARRWTASTKLPAKWRQPFEPIAGACPIAEDMTTAQASFLACGRRKTILRQLFLTMNQNASKIGTEVGLATSTRSGAMPITTLRRLLSILALVLLLMAGGGALALSPSAPLTDFPTEEQAHQHCPADTVVWLNLPTGIYHLRGQRWYGRTNSGAYVCQSEADRGGMRASRNGQ